MLLLPGGLEGLPVGGGRAEGGGREPLHVPADLPLLGEGIREELDGLLVLREDLLRPLGPRTCLTNALRLLLLLLYLAAHREDGGVDLGALRKQGGDLLGGGSNGHCVCVEGVMCI